MFNINDVTLDHDAHLNTQPFIILNKQLIEDWKWAFADKRFTWHQVTNHSVTISSLQEKIPMSHLWFIAVNPKEQHQGEVVIEDFAFRKIESIRQSFNFPYS